MPRKSGAGRWWLVGMAALVPVGAAILLVQDLIRLRRRPAVVAEYPYRLWARQRVNGDQNSAHEPVAVGGVSQKSLK